MADLTPITPQQIQQSPFLSSIFAPMLEPGLGVQQTQAGIANTQVQTSLAQGELAPVTQKANVVAFQNNARQILDAAKGSDGYVNPKVFETLQNQAEGYGVNADNFFQNFGNYSDPTQQVNYNTPEGRQLADAKSQIVRQVEAQVNQYNKIPDAQKGVLSTAYLEGMGPVGKLLAPDAYAYQIAKNGFAGQFKNLTQVNRVTQAELSQWQGLLPDATDSPEVVKKKMQELDTNIQATFNSSYGLSPTFMSQYGGNSTNTPSSNQSGNQMVPMRSPSGSTYNVPRGQLFRAQQNGYSTVNQ